MLSASLTPRQAAILEFVRAYIQTHGYSPTIREIGREFSISSPNGVMCHINALQCAGAIRRSRNKCRTIVPTAA